MSFSVLGPALAARLAAIPEWTNGYWVQSSPPLTRLQIAFRPAADLRHFLRLVAQKPDQHKRTQPSKTLTLTRAKRISTREFSLLII